MSTPQADESPAREPRTGDAPAPAAPAHETPTRVASTREAPAHKTPARETPARETPTREAPAREAKAGATQAGDASARETPARETPAREAPARGTKAGATQAGGAQAGGAGHRAAYFAFDRFPSSKGSAVHIAQMADELFTWAGGGLLGVLGGGGLPRYQREGTREVVRFDAPIPNLIDRAEAFSGWVAELLEQHAGTMEICHVRDPWGALPVVSAPGRAYRVVYEVNGLPSIEMAHTWPWAAPETLGKIRELERFCLERSDAVVVPSRVIGDAVRGLGVPEGKIRLVPNGAEVGDTPARPPGAPERYLVYVGALQPWQGLDVLLRAFARLADLPELRLVICSSVEERRAKPVRRLAERLGVGDRVEWHFTLPHREVAAWLAHAAVSVAPLTGCARNVDQGCAPLKVLESMAAGVPVVASDLPAVRELMADGEHGRLVPADRPAELARAVRILLEYPAEAAAMGRRARAHVARHLTWARSRAELAAVYRAVTADAPPGPGR